MGKLTNVIATLDAEAGLGSKDVAPLLKMLRSMAPDLEPILAAIQAIKIPEMPAYPEPKDVDLTPVLNAIKSVQLDLGPVLKAIEAKNIDLMPIINAMNSIEIPVKAAPIEPRPKRWKLIHHRDWQGNLIETEAIAED